VVNFPPEWGADFTGMSNHQSTGSEDTWKDYMTLIFDNFIDANCPLISMGISVQNREFFINLLYYLNFIRIDKLLQNIILKFDGVIDIRGCVALLSQGGSHGEA
jgi:hypothetical protein